MCAIFWVLWGKHSIRVFRGVNRESSEIFSVFRFHVSFLASILKTFCNYFIGLNLNSWIPFFVDCFFVCPFILSIFSRWKLFSFKKNSKILLFISFQMPHPTSLQGNELLQNLPQTPNNAVTLKVGGKLPIPKQTI